MIIVKVGEDQLEKWRNITTSQEGEEHATYSKMKKV